MGLGRWAADENDGEAKTALRRLRAMPDGPRVGSVLQPFPKIDRKEYLDSIAGSGLNAKIARAPIERVRLDELHGIQNTVRRERVRLYIEDPSAEPKGGVGKWGGPIDLPIVVRVGGVDVIHDGHHRLTAAKLLGDADARVRFIDLDEEKKT